MSSLLVYSYSKSSHSFYFCRISSNVTILSSHVSNLDLSFLVYLVKALLALFFSEEPTSGITDFSVMFYCSLFHLSLL